MLRGMYDELEVNILRTHSEMIIPAVATVVNQRIDLLKLHEDVIKTKADNALLEMRVKALEKQLEDYHNTLEYYKGLRELEDTADDLFQKL